MTVIAERISAALILPSKYSLQWRGIYFGCGMIVALMSFFSPHPVKISSLFITLCLLLLSIWFFAAFLLWLAREHPSDPLRQIISRFPKAFLTAFDRSMLFLTIPLFWSFFAPVKAAIPEVVGFWADPSLATVDRLLFFGNDPWTFTHAIVGPAATKAIDIVYASWILVILVVAFLVAVLGDDRSLGRFYLGWGTIWLVLGVGGAFVLGSAGPIFGVKLGFGFEALLARLEEVHETTPLIAIMASDALWLNYENRNATIGNGISAAPSLHCAIAFFMALFVRETRLFPVAVAYAVIIWIGSVHLGWHYFTDGLISLIGVLLLWPIITKFADRDDRGRSRNQFLSSPP